MSKLDHSDDYDADQSLPPHPASPDIGLGGRLIVILAIMTSVMQGSFVVGASPIWKLWNPLAAQAKGVAPWTVDSAKDVPLPPFKP
jgi:hypothetical protein